MKITLNISSQEETAALGVRLGPLLRPQDVVCFAGALGAGKSTLCRAMIRAACTGAPPADIPSPTFTLVESYEGDHGMINHYDLYRLEQAGDVHELGLVEAMESEICLIEWAERIADILPPHCLIISLSAGENGSSDARTLMFLGDEAWQIRLEAAGLG